MSLWQHLSEQISQHTQQHFEIHSHIAISGGCINESYRLSDGKSSYFVKINNARHGDMFEAEALSLKEISDHSTIRTPRPVCFGQTSSQAFLVLEYLALSGRPDPVILGQQMANMHSITCRQYGWNRDNTIGSTPQQNRLSDDWVNFWREQRLLPQLKLAESNGYNQLLSCGTDRLLSDFDCLFENYTPQASMLHGDLWGGNVAALVDSTPVIFDPAFYYGDRETDIAMTQLFGGFEPLFYTGYNEVWPLNDGYTVRKNFYNLYHIINHLNLFGNAYLKQAITMTECVLAEI